MWVDSFTASSSLGTVLFFFLPSFQYLATDRDQWQNWFVALHYADRWTDCWQTVQLNASTTTVIFTPLPDCSLLCTDLLELPWMTTMLHPSLSLHHKRVLCGAGCCCLLVSLCHHYGVTDRITRMGEGVWGRKSEGGDCNCSRGRSHLGPQESDHLSIHLHMSDSQMVAEHLVTQRGRTQCASDLVKLNLHWEAIWLKSVLYFSFFHKN